MIRVILLKTEGKYSMEGNKVQKKSLKELSNNFHNKTVIEEHAESLSRIQKKELHTKQPTA